MHNKKQSQSVTRWIMQKGKCTESINVLRLTFAVRFVVSSFFFFVTIFVYDTLANYGHSPSAIGHRQPAAPHIGHRAVQTVFLALFLAVLRESAGFSSCSSLAPSFGPLAKLQYASGVGFNKLAMSVAFTYHSLQPRSACHPIPLPFLA